MKKSDLIEAVLKESMSLCTKEQVLQNLEILERLGMKPPVTKDYENFEEHFGVAFKWDEE
jgi:hypothetical protein